MNDFFFPLKIQKAEQIQSAGSAGRVALDIQPLGLQRKLYLMCLLCAKSGPDVAHFLKISGQHMQGMNQAKQSWPHVKSEDSARGFH